MHNLVIIFKLTFLYNTYSKAILTLVKDKPSKIGGVK